MLTLETLTIAELRAHAYGATLNKATPYVSRVLNPKRQGQSLRAEVQGSRLYQVEVSVGESGIISHCTCPVGAQCKHATAVLLKWITSPRSFGEPDAPASKGTAPLKARPVEPPPAARPDQLPDWLLTPFAEREDAIVSHLAEWLEQVKMQTLRQIARKRGWAVKGPDKASVARRVAEGMARPDEALRAAQGLDAEHQRVLSAMVLLGVYGPAEDIARVATAWGPLERYRQISTYTGHLCRVGLAVPGTPQDSYGGLPDLVPDAVGRWLCPIVRQVVAGAPGPRAEQANRSEDQELLLATPYPFVRATNQMALLLEQSPVALRAPMPRPVLEDASPGLRGWDYAPHEVRTAELRGKLRRYADVVLTVPPPQPALPDEAIERLAPVMGDAERLDFAYALLVAAGLCQPGSPVTVWPEVKTQFLRLDEVAQRAQLARTYFVMANWTELWAALRAGRSSLVVRRRLGYVNTTGQQLYTDMAYRRMRVLRSLACLPDGEWIRLDDLFGLLRVVWPRFDESQGLTPGHYGRPSSWFLAPQDDDRPVDTREPATWDRVQGALARQIISGPLHWLGLADLILQDGALWAFRLHGLGDLYWDRAEAPAPAHALAASAGGGENAVTAEGEVVSIRPSAVSAQAHGLLEQIARLEAAGSGRFDYRLDAQTAHRSFEAGLTLEEALAGWERLLPIPMPDTMRAQLTRWWQAYGSVRIYDNLTVIELADDYALAEMKAITSLEAHIVAEVSTRLVVIDGKAAPGLAAELEKAGYTPKQTNRV